MCKRTFGKCVGEVLVASGRMKAAQVELIKRSGQMHVVTKAGLGPCLADCKQQLGLGLRANAAAISGCLAKPDCGAYAQCIRPFLGRR